jgi:hypothetical protein
MEGKNGIQAVEQIEGIQAGNVGSVWIFEDRRFFQGFGFADASLYVLLLVPLWPPDADTLFVMNGLAACNM